MARIVSGGATQSDCSAPPGCVKVVLATNIAETGLTIEIRLVVDSAQGTRGAIR